MSALKDVSLHQIKHSASLSDDYLTLVSNAKRKVAVVFRKDSQPDPLRAYFNAQSVAQKLGPESTEEDIIKGLSQGAKTTSSDFESFKEQASKAGNNLWFSSKR
jgi:hypothetical protein